MSKVKIKPPEVIHTPVYKKWGVQNSYIVNVVRSLGLELLYPGAHAWYWYTDLEGCTNLVPHLLLKSSLYKKDVFTCINYAFKVWNEASSRYGLNTWVPVIGRIPNYEPRHAWNLILLGNVGGLIRDHFLYLEPNDGWDMGIELETAGQAFPVGEEGYQGELVFM